MKQISVEDAFFEGAVSVEHGDSWVRPWRLPCERRDLYVSPEDSLVGRAMESSGVRLRFETDATRIQLNFLPLSCEPANPSHVLDVTVDDELVASVPVAPESDSALFEALPAGSKVVELWLPHDSSIEVTGMSVDDDATCRVAPDPRPRWVTYGSSLTHCVRAHSPARTWPAVVARRSGLHLTSLGYGGNCCLEPMLGIMIRDLPADFISLKLGINCIGGALAPRTFAAAAMGLVQIIREKKPETPLALISPIAYPPNETTPNVVGYTIQGMRRDLEDVHSRLVQRGDTNVYYFSGLDIFNEAENAEYTEDQCHPDGDGIELMAEHFLERIMPEIRM